MTNLKAVCYVYIMVMYYLFWQLNKLTVPVLKECIKKAKIKTAATKKADLITAINDHYGIS